MQPATTAIPNRNFKQFAESPSIVAILRCEMKVIIAGARDFTDYDLLKKTMETCGFVVTEVVWGGASGADALGKMWADEHGIPVKPFPADWNRYKKFAGPIRNKQMAEYGEALVAFLAKDSKGTKDMVRQAKKKGLPMVVVNI